ncbi:MAG: hypothetical protein CVV23_14840 [Ignavibacteriae bacterium HGW-Ignavibacteriae-2]|jgi:RimJ/RimL family protein N-acetyltransferase|nr:GNAT family N-acetyltransferase [Bacteroidota bacterium]PKL87546.1 MAG: hypothetical protein CVV23_14840 [Ignavibacteriae bacterium HGW-Ignavibacteriae-2]
MSIKNAITDATIEALSRNFFKEAASYGFRYEHYLKFVNTLLDQALNVNGIIDNKTVSDVLYAEVSELKLPINSAKFGIREYDKKTDFNLLKKWLEDDYGKYFLYSTMTSTEISVEKLIHDPKNFIGVIILPDGEEIGLMAYLNWDKSQKKAELRKIIGNPSLRGKGYGKEATRLWISYGKNTLKLRKIYLYTLETNLRNIKLNEELGFKVEGILRNEILIDKVSHDVLRMGLVFESSPKI